MNPSEHIWHFCLRITLWDANKNITVNITVTYSLGHKQVAYDCVIATGIVSV